MWKLKAIITNSGLCLGASLLWLTSMLGLLASTSLAQSMQELKLTVGKSVVIDYPEDIGRISTSAPEVADYVAVSTREVLLNANNHPSER